MSKGPGKIEREILNVIKNARIKGIKYLSIIQIARFVHKKTYMGFAGKVTHSQYTTVCRAVKSLKRKHYVEIITLKKGDKGFSNRSLELKKEATRIKIIKPGTKMYAEKEWLKHIKHIDMKKEEKLPSWYKK